MSHGPFLYLTSYYSNQPFLMGTIVPEIAKQYPETKQKATQMNINKEDELVKIQVYLSEPTGGPQEGQKPGPGA